jgi:uncharacterized protein
MITGEFAARELKLYNEAMELGFSVQHYPGTQIGTCGAVRTGGFLVEPDGTLQTCWTVVGRKDTKVGEIVDSTLQLNDNYDKWLSWSPFEKKECESCSILPLCMGGCPYKSLFYAELPPTQKSACPSWKYNLKEMMKFVTEAQKLGLLVSSRSQLERTRKKVGQENDERR